MSSKHSQSPLSSLIFTTQTDLCWTKTNSRSGPSIVFFSSWKSTRVPPPKPPVSQELRPVLFDHHDPLNRSLNNTFTSWGTPTRGSTSTAAYQVESVLMSRHLDSRGFDLRDAALLCRGRCGVGFFSGSSSQLKAPIPWPRWICVYMVKLYLHVPLKSTKCQEICHSWILWVGIPVSFRWLFVNHPVCGWDLFALKKRMNQGTCVVLPTIIVSIYKKQETIRAYSG